MYLFAADTYLDLGSSASSRGGAQEKALKRQVNRYLQAAREATDRATESGASPGTIEYLVAHSQLLSDDERDQRRAEATLRDLMGRGDTEFDVRSALAAHLTRRGRYEDAIDDIQALQAESPLAWLRAVGRLAAHGRRAEVIEVLDGAEERIKGTGLDAYVRLLRARVLIRGDSEERAQAVDALVTLAGEESLDQRIVLIGYRVLVDAGFDAEAIRVLDAVRETAKDPRVDALKARALVRMKPQEGLKIVDDLADQTQTLRDSMRVAAVLQQPGKEAQLRFLARKIEARDADEASYRVIRAMVAGQASAAKEVSDARRKQLLESVVADLSELRTLSCRKQDLQLACALALAAERFDLAGDLCGLAISQPGPPHSVAYRVLSMARNEKNAEPKKAFARGLRRGVRVFELQRFAPDSGRGSAGAFNIRC